MSPGRRRSPLPPAAPTSICLALLVLLGSGPDPLQGQERVLTAPSGERLEVSRDSVLSMLARTRALYDTLEQDPLIVYYVGYGKVAPRERPADAYPWRAVRVRSDSAVEVVTPENLREADRAYFNYAVVRMRERSAALDSAAAQPTCSEKVDREVRLLEAFADGWIVARTLFGAREYPPLTEIPFARDAGHLAAYAVHQEVPQLGDCSRAWRENHPERMAEYRRWRSEHFLGEAPDSTSADTVTAVHYLRR